MGEEEVVMNECMWRSGERRPQLGSVRVVKRGRAWNSYQILHLRRSDSVAVVRMRCRPKTRSDKCKKWLDCCH